MRVEEGCRRPERERAFTDSTPAEQQETPPREHERSFSLHSHLALHFRCFMSQGSGLGGSCPGDAAKRAREKFQPTLPSCSSLQMFHVTGVWAWGGAVWASIFRTVLPGKFLGKSGKGSKRFGLSTFREVGGRNGLLNLSAGLVFTLPPAPPRRILTGKGPLMRLGGPNSAE